jgi:hypothetical protein
VVPADLPAIKYRQRAAKKQGSAERDDAIKA